MSAGLSSKMKGIRTEWSVHEVYTTRACDELALTLAEVIPGGEIVHVRTFDDDSDGFLVHAGVERDDVVYDIEGAHDFDEWFRRWGSGLDVDLMYRTPASEQATFASEESRKVAEDVARHLIRVPELEGVGQPGFALV